jgi:hypothetical protein
MQSVITPSSLGTAAPVAEAGASPCGVDLHECKLSVNADGQLNADCGRQHKELRRCACSEGVENFLARLQGARGVDPGEGGIGLHLESDGVFRDGLLEGSVGSFDGLIVGGNRDSEGHQRICRAENRRAGDKYKKGVAKQAFHQFTSRQITKSCEELCARLSWRAS